MISGCESNVPTQSVDESETLQKIIEQPSNSLVERPYREPGPIDTRKTTKLIEEVLKEQGRNPAEIRFGNLSDKGYALKGEEAWEKYMKDWSFEGESFGKPVNTVYGIESGIFSYSSLPPNPAQTTFGISEIQNTPTSGSVTVQYLGEQVTTNYTSSWNAYAVANTIGSNINNDSDIDLTATVNGTTVTVTEKRDGCAYNGNSVYVSHTNGTHITVNNDVFIMTGGEDPEGCDDVPPPPDDDDGSNVTPIAIAWGSVIDPPAGYGWIDLWSYSASSQNIDYIDVAGYSYKDYIIISSGQDGGYNEDTGIVGTSEYIDPLDDEAHWEQMGDHLFVETNVYYQVPSWVAINF